MTFEVALFLSTQRGLFYYINMRYNLLEVKLMDMRRKKELLEAYKNRRPDMGVIAYKCITTGESFLGASTDIKADFNSTTMKLSSGYHPNKRLLELWKIHGPEGFELSVIEVLEYKDEEKNLGLKVEKLREKYLEEYNLAEKIWK